VSLLRPQAPTATGRIAARELREMATAVLLHPVGSSQSGTRTLVRLLAPGGTGELHRTPVLLVHGYGGSRIDWLPLELRLRRAGVVNVDAIAYNPTTRSLPTIARALVSRSREAMARTGTDHVDLVGHSLGGIVLRYAIQELGMAAHVRTAVTVATPHQGTRVASLGCGGLAATLRTNSPTLEGLRRRAAVSDVRWVAYYSDCDLIVRPDSARLTEPVLQAVNVNVPDVGHLGILRAPQFLDSVVQLLVADEHPSGDELPAAAAEPRILSA
jgi:predicted alpha/beta hydrolase family esterase